MAVPSGALRFNADSRKLEYYNGEAWWQIDSFTPDAATGGARGVVAGGYVAPTQVNTIDYINISSTGNAISFGSLTRNSSGIAACASNTFAVFGGGGPNTTTIDYVTISSTGNALSFGSLTAATQTAQGCSNATRGIFGGGYAPTGSTSVNTLQYITIASTGNAVSFGQLTSPRGCVAGTCASSTRGIFAGGYASPVAPSTNVTNAIDFITISTLGNSSSFGQLTSARGGGGGCSNSTRGLFASGASPSVPSPSLTSVIDYITIASLGNATSFGNLTTAVNEMNGGMSSPTRGVWGGGHSGGGVAQNRIEYVTIASLGNAISFGQLTQSRRGPTACSNGHGGL